MNKKSMILYIIAAVVAVSGVAALAKGNAVGGVECIIVAAVVAGVGFWLGKRGKVEKVEEKYGKTEKNSLLVLSERKTRDELLFKLPEHTTAAVVAVLDSLEAQYGERFSDVFKTITVDNGTEFADCEGLEGSSLGDYMRTKLYYCHPYSSWERGTNENTNKMVRRKIPKGVNFDDMTDEDIQAVEDWINNYPRELLGFYNAGDLFRQEMAKIGL